LADTLANHLMTFQIYMFRVGLIVSTQLALNKWGMGTDGLYLELFFDNGPMHLIITVITQTISIHCMNSVKNISFLSLSLTC